MTPVPGRPAEFTPIFDWSAPRGRKLSLFSFLAASAFLHALCFYLFQIIYPPTIALLPPPARVNLITGSSEAGRLLRGWIEAEDPALASTTQRPAGAGHLLPPDPPHVPSYANHRPALKQLPPHQPDLRIPSAQPPGPVRMAQQQGTPAPIALVPSRVRFAENAAKLGAPVIPSLQFTASTKEPPATAQFLIGVSSSGSVRYCFLEGSSGDPSLDEQARRVLLLCRFPAMQPGPIQGAQLLWTPASLEWGNDLGLPAAAGAAASTP